MRLLPEQKMRPEDPRFVPPTPRVFHLSDNEYGPWFKEHINFFLPGSLKNVVMSTLAHSHVIEKEKTFGLLNSLLQKCGIWVAREGANPPDAKELITKDKPIGGIS